MLKISRKFKYICGFLNYLPLISPRKSPNVEKLLLCLSIWDLYFYPYSFSISLMYIFLCLFISSLFYFLFSFSSSFCFCFSDFSFSLDFSEFSWFSTGFSGFSEFFYVEKGKYSFEEKGFNFREFVWVFIRNLEFWISNLLIIFFFLFFL